jgi:signal transduction histidine kinase
VPHPTGETPVPHLTGDTPVPHAADRMQEIIASVDRMNQWIAGLMEVAQQEPTAARALDVRPTLQRVREAVAPELAAKELSLEVDVPSDPLLCAHDPATLEHALIAITVNAIEASPLGGRIELHAEPVHRRDAGATDGRDRACRIAVLDSGPGLPPDAPDRIFEFSYSTKQEGMGLGLALARLALQRRGATTGAVNRPEGGAEVFIEIPLDQAGPRDSETAGQRDSAPPPESRRPTIPLSLRPESAIRNSQSAIPEDLYAQDPDRRG